MTLGSSAAIGPRGSSAVTRRMQRAHALGWSMAAFALGCGLSLIASLGYRQLLLDEASKMHERAAERTRDSLRTQLETCSILVRSMQALFLASHDVTAEEFERMYASLRPQRSFPSLQAVVFARRVEMADGDHYVTDLVAPRIGNEAVFGLDVTSQPANLRAVQISRDANETAMSGSFRLVQRLQFDEPTDGLVIRLPVYSSGPMPETVEERRARDVGSLGVSFRASELIRAGLGGALDPAFEVRVIDDSATPPQLLYSSAGHGLTPAGVDTAQPAVRALEFGGRQWRVVFAPTELAGQSTSPLPWIGLGIGIVSSALIALMIWVLATTRERALAAAERMSARYRESETRFGALNELLPVAVLLERSSDGRLMHVNEGARRLFALTAEDESTARFDQFIVDDDVRRRLAAGAGEDLTAQDAATMRAADGRQFAGAVAVRELELDGERMRLWVVSDISELRELTHRLDHQASHDELTDLYNRREFERRLQLAARGDDPRNRFVALLYLDLDQFKLINDVSGHVAGDRLIAELGGLLRARLQDGDVLARLGGDEFGVLVADGSHNQVLELAERLRRTVDDFTFSWEGRSYMTSVSIGVVLIDPQQRHTLRELLSLADTACYMAKERGRNRVQLFSQDDLATSRRRDEMEWVARLKQALAEDRFCLYYQELQSLKAHRGTHGAHFEVLLRLRDERGEMVPPGAFIPAAERFGLMPTLDRWVISTALRHFDRLHPAGSRVELCAINLSATTMDDDSFPDFVCGELQRSGVQAERVCFEITETAAVANLARTVQLIERLRDLGCRFAIDDFGAGMSSFGYLKNLPVDYLKIDGSFIREIETDPMSYAIVRAVTDIGHQAGCDVVAEFVPNARARELLRGIGVDFAQGFAIHKPAPAGITVTVAA